MPRTPLPIDEHLPDIIATIRRERKAIIVAPPGSGKTTRIPPELTELGRTILLQPRRVAARALTRRIALERGWTVGEEIGWHIRLERRFSSRTRLLVATEGILTARLQSDPLLSDFSVIVLDEFHERSIHADVALALARQALLSRDDLVLVVMSATLDTQPLRAFLDAPVIEVAARSYPIEISYRPGMTVAEAVRKIAPSAKGHILCFLPGVREIERTAASLEGIAGRVLPLHGSLDVDAQERALEPSSDRKVIIATNVAETSLTVEGVTDVIDSGQQKLLRYDAETAVDHLVTEQISIDSAEQRTGRAGRTAPGRATRLWAEQTMLRPHREPEIRRIDLAGALLDIIAWGGDPQTLEWYERPPQYRLDAATDLLQRLGAIEGGRLTASGNQMRAFPLHPRLARLIIEAQGADDGVALAVELSEGRKTTDEKQRSACREISGIARRLLGSRFQAEIEEESIRRAALAAYPDRVAQRREAGDPRLLLATGTGAQLAREIEHTRGDYFVALDVRGETVFRAIQIERDWLTPNRREVVHEIAGDRVRALERIFYDALLLREQQVPADPLEVARLVGSELRDRIDPALLRRIDFAGIDIDWDRALQNGVTATTRLSGVDFETLMPYDARRKLDRLAPLTLALPSGRSTKLDYREDGSVVASVKLQELFGLAETPRIGARQTPVTFALLSPGGRPVQVTRDLRSFWNTTYPEVRKELRARYPKHPWPENPWNAQPTHRTKKRQG